MEAINVEIVNPKAKKLLRYLAELDLIHIKPQISFENDADVFREKARQQVATVDIQSVLQQADEEEVRRMDKLFEKYQFSFKNFKFNRDEANNYD